MEQGYRLGVVEHLQDASEEPSSKGGNLRSQPSVISEKEARGERPYLQVT